MTIRCLTCGLEVNLNSMKCLGCGLLPKQCDCVTQLTKDGECKE